MFSALLLLAQLAKSAKVTSPNKVPKNAVLLSKVKSLTVRGDKKTASRRVSAVPQLQCVGPPEICKLYQVDVMRCTNEGADYDAENIQWACKASLPDDFKLGSTDVSCEGYESSDDPYVLKGSCGVEYRLMLTEEGESKYGKTDDYNLTSSKSGGGEKLAGYLFMVVFLIVLFVILRSLYNAWQRDGPRGGGRRGGAGWGGGPGDDDPPPPYDDQPYNSPKKRAYTPRASTGTRASSSRANAGNQQGWRPGFWTGTAAGAAAGYLAGNRNQARTQPETVERRPGGGLFGGGGGSSWNRQPSSGPSSSPPSFSSSRHESTGFGSTSRRTSPTPQADDNTDDMIAMQREIICDTPTHPPSFENVQPQQRPQNPAITPSPPTTPLQVPILPEPVIEPSIDITVTAPVISVFRAEVPVPPSMNVDVAPSPRPERQTTPHPARPEAPSLSPSSPIPASPIQLPSTPRLTDRQTPTPVTPTSHSSSRHPSPEVASLHASRASSPCSAAASPSQRPASPTRSPSASTSPSPSPSPYPSPQRTRGSISTVCSGFRMSTGYGSTKRR